MNIDKQEILRLLDWERQTVVHPGAMRFADTGVIREVSTDGKSGEIVYSSCSEGEIDSVIERQIQTARREGYELEWKVYGHDQPPCLRERLTAAGFEAGDREQFMVLDANAEGSANFGACGHNVRRVTDREGLRDYQTIREEVGGRAYDREIQRYAAMLKDHPGNMSVYIAYVDGEPAACGRIYFHAASRFAGLYGGTTRERFRKRGLFTQIVGARLREAVDRGVFLVCVDALPTSEPILRKRGFESVTDTQPYLLG